MTSESAARLVMMYMVKMVMLIRGSMIFTVATTIVFMRLFMNRYGGIVFSCILRVNSSVFC